MSIKLRNVACVCAVVLAGFAWPSVAGAQVVIDMPAPPKRTQPTPMYQAPADADGPAATISTSSSTTTPPVMYPVSVAGAEVGDIALARYSDARSGTYDTYMNDGSYFNNGIRTYSYPYYVPQYVWGPWWGGWGWGWPIMGFHSHCD